MVQATETNGQGIYILRVTSCGKVNLLRNICLHGIRVSLVWLRQMATEAEIMPFVKVAAGNIALVKKVCTRNEKYANGSSL
eukprot:794526-Amphidinium_carterae.2